MVASVGPKRAGQVHAERPVLSDVVLPPPQAAKLATGTLVAATQAMRVAFPGLVLAALVAVAPGCTIDPGCGYTKPYCEGTVLHTCATHNNMFRTHYDRLDDCADTSQVCATDADGGFCATSAAPDARCSLAGGGGVCDGNTALTCRSGYLVSPSDCGAQTCVSVAMGGYGQCMDTSAPCFHAADGWYCDGATARKCMRWRTTDEASCYGCVIDEHGFPMRADVDGGATDCRW